MNKQSFHKRILFIVTGFVVLSCGLYPGCGKKDSPNDDLLIKKIEGEKWPACDGVSPKTVYDTYFKTNEFARRLILAGRVSSITEELDRSRERFVNTGDLIEIFPLVYFYEMQHSLEAGMKPRMVHKIEYMELLIAGFDAYKYNRDAYDSGDKQAVGRQWREYFSAVEAAQKDGRGKWNPQDGVDALGVGFDAHLLSDLPRAIRYVVEKSDTDKVELQRDFDASNTFFAVAEARAKGDILKMFENKSARDEANQVFGNGSEFVAFARKKAWEMAVGGGPLGVLAEQPHFEHDAQSRIFFPKELMERGICR